MQTPVMTLNTAKDYATASLIADLKKICGDRFEYLTPRSRLTVLTTFSQFQLLSRLESGDSRRELMIAAIDAVPAVCWTGHEELRFQVARCCQLEEPAITQLIQAIANSLAT